VYVGDDGYYYVSVGGRLKRFKPVTCPECGTTDIEVVPYGKKREVRCPYCDKSFYFDSVVRCPVCGELLPPDVEVCTQCGTRLVGEELIAEESYLAPKEKIKVINIEHKLNSKFRKELESIAERDKALPPYESLKALAEAVLQRGVLRGAERYVELADGAVVFKKCGAVYRNGEFYRGEEKIDKETLGKECWRDELEEVMALYGLYRSHYSRLRLEGKGRRGKALVQAELPRGHNDEVDGFEKYLQLAECLNVDVQNACMAYARAVALKAYGEKPPKCAKARGVCGDNTSIRYALADIIAERGAPPVSTETKALLLLSFYVEQATTRCQDSDIQCKRRLASVRAAYSVMSQDREVYEKMVDMYTKMDRGVYMLASLVKSSVAAQGQVNSAMQV